MPTNKNALIRMKIIDECLRSRTRKWTWRDILEKVNIILEIEQIEPVKKTTFYEDLKEIESGFYGGEIERIRDGKVYYLRYLDPNFSILKETISEKEANQIKSALSILSRFKGAPQFEWVNEIIPSIQSKLGFINSERKIIEFHENIDYSGLELISPLFELINNKQTAVIEYRGFSHRESRFIEISPQYLKQYNNRWYLYGLNVLYGKEIQIYPLDRIMGLKESSSKYAELVDFDWSDYFADMMGVSRLSESNEPQLVKLLILDAEQASYIKTKPLHWSQKKLKRTKNGFETSIKVLLNYELQKILLSFGSKIVVLSPKSLKDKLFKHIISMQENYTINVDT